MHSEHERASPAPPKHGQPHNLVHEPYKKEDEDRPTSITAYASHRIKAEVDIDVALPPLRLHENEDDFGLDQVDDTIGRYRQHESTDSKGRDSSEGDSKSDADSGDSSSDSDFEGKSSSEDNSVVDKPRRCGKSARSKQTAGKKLERQSPAKNAREYVARLHQAEDEAAQRKRKRGLDDQRAGRSKKKAIDNQATGILSHLTNGQDDENYPSVTAPPMKAIKATTHAEQMALMKANIPAGSDTRRTKTQSKDLDEARKLFGYKQVKALDGNWRLKRMNTALKPHQITASAWMIKRELGRAAPYGGVLADVMGLGKTVMSLACITGNPPQKDDVKDFSRATLVVVPNKTIALQWKEEVQKHCKSPIGDWVSAYNPKEDNPLGMYKKIRVLITTYHELTTEYPSENFLAQMKDRHDGDEPSYRKAVAKKLGFLFKTKWYRVILDEAHAIKNINSRKLFPYLKFIRCGCTESLRDFQRKYMTEASWTKRTCEKILKIREQRKTREVQGNDEKIVTKLQYAMFMKLRQLISHPFNLEKLLRTTITTKEIHELKAKFGESGANDSILDQMMAREKNELGLELEEYQTGLNFLRKRKEPVFGGKFEWNAMLDMFGHELEAQNFACCSCKTAKPPVRPVQLEMNKCGHYYCEDCHQILRRMCNAGAQQKDSIPHGTCLAPDCTFSINNLRDFRTLGHITKDAAVFRFREPGRDANEVQIIRDEAENGCFIASALLDDCQLVPSTKLTATMAVLATWLKDHPDDKIIGKILGRMLEMSGYKSNFLYYFGGMSQPQRNRCLRDFKEDPEKKVLVASMQCGGQSLNLTVANRVILVDPWWNTTAEKQAFGRVLRIGQEKTSHLVRIMASDSADTMMSSLQEVKSEQIDHALQDDGHVPLAIDDEVLQKMLAPGDFNRRL
ncbi:putative ATP-dependent helicase [Tolypocladium ophioglossoides CBS 100239]|uniref:Putative ATP-dependent helicase n=1 Tax=Tolypocladium ophioglossoides (strain CBS 100239) TaxID=1163406 RepID=A0A0L0N094_TOLOC|nr:putative ATP-dependent helicase [Tolypocladium ophioglossoides CBS 100239]